jgi:hypothetical protein
VCGVFIQDADTRTIYHSHDLPLPGLCNTWEMTRDFVMITCIVLIVLNVFCAMYGTDPVLRVINLLAAGVTYVSLVNEMERL